jgi:predicted DNA-binding transcriptional regulator AlpA
VVTAGRFPARVKIGCRGVTWVSTVARMMNFFMVTRRVRLRAVATGVGLAPAR